MTSRSRRHGRARTTAAAARSGALTPTEASPRLWPLVLGVGTLALVPRLVLLAQLHDHPLLRPDGALDSAVYVRLAQRAASGNWALGPDVYFVSPLYLYFLAALFRLFGPDLLLPKLVQAGLGAIAASLVAATGGILFGRRVAWVAGFLAALTGLFAFNEVLLLQSSLDPFLTALALFLLAWALKSGSIGTWVVAGVSFGALCANRPNAGLAVLLVLLLHVGVRRNRGAITHALALLLGLSLATAPFALRNWLVAGECVWLTSHGGLNFYIGNHAEADGRYHSVEGIEPSIEGQALGARTVAEQARGRGLSSGEVSDYFYERALEWMHSNPAPALRLLARKALLVLNSADFALNYSFNYYRLDEPTLLRWLFVGLPLLVPLGILGTLVRPPERVAGVFATWAFFLPAYAVSVALFFVASRYRLPLLVGLCVTAGAAAVQLADWTRQGHARAVGASVLCLAALAALTLLPLAPDEGRANERTERIVRWIADGNLQEARQLLTETEAAHPAPGLLFYRVGRAYQDRGDLSEAIAFFERAVRASPGGGEPVVRMSLGQALAAAGRTAEAIPHFAAARDAGVSPALAGYELTRALAEVGRGDDARAELGMLKLPEDAPPAARVAVGQLAHRLGETNLALAILNSALSHDPAFAPAHEALGVVLEALGRHPEAIAHLAEACRLDPSSADARFNLAVLMVRDSRLEEARQLLREALRISPDYEPAQRLLAQLDRAPRGRLRRE